MRTGSSGSIELASALLMHTRFGTGVVAESAPQISLFCGGSAPALV